MTFEINRFPLETQLKLYEKLSAKQLCRFRATCKGIDGLVEEHRFHLSKKRQDRKQLITVYIEAGQIVVSDWRNRFTLEKPFERLSAISPTIMIYGQNDQAELFSSFFRQMKFSLSELIICDMEADNSIPLDVWRAIISSCTFTKLNVNPRTGGISELFTIESVQNARELIILPNNDSLDKNFLQHLRKVEKIVFCNGLQQTEQILLEVIPQMITDAASREPPLHISFTWRDEVDPLLIFPNAQLIYRKTATTDHFSSLTGYSQLFACQKIFLIFEAHTRETQKWTFHFVNREKTALKEVLKSNYEGSLPARVLDRMFNKIIDGGEAPVLAEYE